MPSFARYFALWAGLSAACLGGVALFNLVLDPFGAYRLVETPASPYRYVGSRTGKAELLRHVPCQDVIVGTSRAEVGIDPGHDVFEGRVACNAALANTSMVEVAEMVRVALEQPATERIFLFLDFMLFSSDRGTTDDFAQSRLSPERGAFEYHVGHLLGAYATKKSLGMLRFAWKGEEPAYDGRGHRVGGPGRKTVIARELFRRSLHSFLDDIYASYDYSEEHVSRLRGAIARAGQRGVEVVIVIPPVHALQLEAITASGLWEVFEEWKRDLTRIAVLESPGGPIPVWGFTGYAPYNRTPVPDEEALASATPWYWESSHFKVALGDLVLTRATGGVGDVDFGGRLAPATVEQHLSRLREHQRQYLAANPEDLDFFDRVQRAAGAS